MAVYEHVINITKRDGIGLGGAVRIRDVEDSEQDTVPQNVTS